MQPLDQEIMELPPFPLVVERGLTPRDAIGVGSWGFSLLFIRSQRCPCGGHFSSLASKVHPAHLECHRAQCGSCNRIRPFWFDIELFEGDERAHFRFEELRVLFEEGMERVTANDLVAARPKFEEVTAREPWFGVAWFHLGMIALVEERYEEALSCLEKAVGILPLDASIHHSMAEFWTRRGDEEKASRSAWMSMALEASLDDDSDER